MHNTAFPLIGTCLGWAIVVALSWLWVWKMGKLVSAAMGRAERAEAKVLAELHDRMAEVAAVRADAAEALRQAVADEQQIAAAQRDKLMGILVMAVPIILDRARLREGQRDGEHSAWLLAGLNRLGLWGPEDKDTRLLAKGIAIANRDRAMFERCYALPIGIRRDSPPATPQSA
ncbi:MAG: hypothetical protein ABIL09_03985 [Gemmatimonadota bacterium]